MIVSLRCQARLQEHRPARPEGIAPLRHAVVEFAADSGASERQCEDIALAVSEALSNSVVHAYVGCDSPGSMAIQAWTQGQSLQVVVCDAGTGMCKRTDSPGLGLGLELIERMTTKLQIDSLDTMSGVRLRMTFAIG